MSRNHEADAMQRTIKTRSGRTIIRPTPEEEAAIQRGIAQDPDNPEWTADDFKKARRLGDRVKRPDVGRRSGNSAED